jgi:hypothetical protein
MRSRQRPAHEDRIAPKRGLRPSGRLIESAGRPERGCHEPGNLHQRLEKLLHCLPRQYKDPNQLYLHLKREIRA